MSETARGAGSVGRSADSGRFVPPYPPRGPGPVAAWRGFFGERARTAVHGWSEQAFETWYLRRNVLGYRVHIPLQPDLVQHVLLDRAENYVKPTPVLKLLAPTIGRGLLSSDGALWREQRRIVAASFTPAAVDGLIPLFADVAAAASESWSAGERDMAQAATSTTMRIIAEALFGGDSRLASEAAGRHITAALEGAGEARLQVLLGLPIIPMSRRGWAAKRGQLFLRATLGAAVEDRLQGRRQGDFLAGLVAALQERFDRRDALALAVDNAATFYLAGHETTANAVTWTLFLLSEQPALQEELAAEAASAGPAPLEPQLPRLRAVIDEALRLYPPAPRFDRQAAAEDRMGEVEVRAGDIVSIWPWLIHRHKRLWDDADAFVADRFSNGPGPERHRFQFIPFGGGPRTCVGARFALAEALAILATWLARWRFAPVPGRREVRTSGMVTLRPAGGLPLQIQPR